jgi:hypothetical protein
VFHLVLQDPREMREEGCLGRVMLLCEERMMAALHCHHRVLPGEEKR